MKKEAIFIEHILENIKDIEKFTDGIKEEELAENKEKFNAVVRSIEVIGEAAKNLPEGFKRKHSNIPWKAIIGTRDKMIHHYFGIEHSIVWDIVKKEIPKLKKQMEEILKEIRF